MGLSAKNRQTLRTLRLLALLCATVTMLTGCAPDEIEPGVYVASLSDDVTTWIGAPAAAPVWSPDGNSIAWGTERGIYVGQPGGHQTRRMTESPVAGIPTWSPDGATIAYVATDSASLVIVDATSGAETLEVPIRNVGAVSEASDIVSIGGPSWRPDGSQLAFICWDGQGDEICVINADGSDRRQVTHIEPLRRSTTSGATAGPAGSNVGPPVWSPDGASLAVPAYAEIRGTASGIIIVLLEQGIARRVTSLQPTSDVLWTSDGGALLFAASVEGRTDVYRVSASGGLARNLTRSLPDGARDPALSPDGRELAVASGRHIQILGQRARKIGSGDESMRDRHPAWSPDGEELAFSSSPALVTKYD